MTAMPYRHTLVALCGAFVMGALQSIAFAQDPSAPPANKLFAVEFRVGPNWVADKPPGEQAHFRDHSANLRRLREEGILVLGARYSDKGLVVLSAPSESAARALIDEDPAVKYGIFIYELHPFLVFYGGTLSPPPRS